MNNNANTNYRVNALINMLQKDRDILVPRLHRKEIAAWAAILFYVAMLWALFQLLIQNNNLIKDDSHFLILGLLIAILFGGFIVFRFLHSQYAVIYDWEARWRVFRDMILQLIEKEDGFLEENHIKISNLTEYIKVQVRSRKENEVQQFIGKIHPLKIFLYFWFLWPIIKPWCKVFKKEIKKDYLTNHEKQEASIYSLLIVVTLIPIFFLLAKLFGLAGS
jgi:hypothetical protein